MTGAWSAVREHIHSPDSGLCSALGTLSAGRTAEDPQEEAGRKDRPGGQEKGSGEGVGHGPAGPEAGRRQGDTRGNHPHWSRERCKLGCDGPGQPASLL